MGSNQMERALAELKTLESQAISKDQPPLTPLYHGSKRIIRSKAIASSKCRVYERYCSDSSEKRISYFFPGGQL